MSVRYIKVPKTLTRASDRIASVGDASRSREPSGGGLLAFWAVSLGPRPGLGTELDARHERAPDRTRPRARPGTAPRVTPNVSEPQLLNRRANLAARMNRNDVINRRRTPRTRRRLEVDRLPAQLAAIVRPRAQLRHQPCHMHPPKVPVSPTRPSRHQQPTLAAPNRHRPWPPELNRGFPEISGRSGRYFRRDGGRVTATLKKRPCTHTR
jgi:hypothetical protein